MVKEIYDTYGYAEASLENLARAVEEILGIELRACESSYSGVTYRYRGAFSDEIVIKHRTEYDSDVYPILIKVSNTSGKNADKLSKSKYIKEGLLRIPAMHFVLQNIIETKN